MARLANAATGLTAAVLRSAKMTGCPGQGPHVADVSGDAV